MALIHIASPDNSRWLSKSPFLCVLLTDFDVTVYDCRLRVEVILNTDPSIVSPGNTKGVYRYIQKFDAQGKIEFDFSGLIDEFIGNKYTSPSDSINSVFDVPDGDIFVWVLCHEIIDGVEQQVDYLHSLASRFLPYQVFQGGMSRDVSLFGEYWQYRFIKEPLLPFLTWKPKTRITDKEFPTYLYYLGEPDLAIRLEVKIYWDTTLIEQNPSFWSYVLPITHMVFPSGWRDLNIDGMLATSGWAGEPPTHYTVQLFNIATDEPVSEIITYRMDYKYYKNRLLLYYQNGIIGFDEIRLTGEVNLKAEYNRISGNIPFDLFSQQWIDGLSKVFSSNEQITYKVFTQYMQPEEVHQLRALALAPRVFMRLENSYMMSVELTEKSKEWIVSGKFMQEPFIEFKQSYKNRVFTPITVFNDLY
jgi:hypothetical protein